MSLPAQVKPDGFFLSATNPIATTDQRDLEALAMRVSRMPAAVAGKQVAGLRWKTTLGREAPAEAWGKRFDDMLDAYAFNSVMKAVNSDANHPKVLGHWQGPAHEWFGMKVPDSRAGGGDSPDNNYSIIPVDGRARFEIIGTRFANGTADVQFTAMNFTLSTLGNMEWQDVVVGANGKFVITIDPKPANGRPNHLQSKLGTEMILIRDSRADWRQVSNAYRIRRLDPPAAAPLTEEQMAQRAAEFMISDIPVYFWFMRTFGLLDVNTISPPIAMGNIGALVSQKGSWARLHLNDDEAFVITLSPGRATFRNIVLHDTWFRTLDYWNRTSNLCSAQAIANGDGSFTYVVAARDPGVHNWLDTGGLHHLQLLHRWQGLPRKAAAEGEYWTKGALVKFDALDSALPKDVKRITPAEREQQLAERLAQFRLRYVDH